MPEYKSPQSEPGTENKLLLILLLVAAVIFGSQLYLRKNAPPAKQPANATQPNPAANQPSPATPSQPPKASLSAVQKAAPPLPTSTKEASSESDFVVENDVYRIVFSNRGAQVKSWVLKDYKDDQGRPLDMVNSVAAAKYGYPLSLWTYDENLRNQLNSALYVPSSSHGLPATQGSAPITLNAPADLSFEYSGAGLTVRKTFHFEPNSYVVGLETTVTQNGAPLDALPAWPSGFGDQTTLPAYEASELEYQVNSKVERTSVKKISGGNTLHGTYDWIGITSQYFTAVFIPKDPDNVDVVTLRNAIEIAPDPNKPDQTKPADVVGVAVGHPGNSVDRLFVGPKSPTVLDTVAVPTITGADKDLRGVVDFGFFGVIARPLFIWLRWTNQYIHNWGWSIVLQTFIITIALVPMRYYQLRSALKMQRVQPQMKAIQEKYKKYSMRDPRKQEMNKEVADLYKREGVNPVGGCLPMLIQLPFLYAYYRMLYVSVDLRQAHWLWIHDLSAADPWFLLPIIMVISMFALQKMTPQAGMDPKQQRMMNIMMPLMMGFIFFRLPAGLNLYYAESNLIMIAQTAIMNRTELGQEMRAIAAKRARKKKGSS